MDNENFKFDDDMAHNPFVVPENYFEDFAARIESSVAEDDKAVSHPGRKIDFRRWMAIVMSSAAVFVGLVVCGYVLLSMQRDVEAQAEQIVAQEAYVDEMIDMVDVDYIENVLADVAFADYNE